MKSLISKFVGALLEFYLIMISAITRAHWYDSSWRYRKTITIDSTKVKAPLTSLPVLISMTDTDLRDKAQNDGHDILFSSSNGKAKLSHEMERFDGSTGELIAWVKVPSLSSSKNTRIYMYYGNPDTHFYLLNKSRSEIRTKKMEKISTI